METKVVYIVGPPYSGSTFFAALLGVHPRMEAASELNKWGRLRHRTDPRWSCSCGLSLAECRFWLDVTETWRARSSPVTLERFEDVQGRIEMPSDAWRRALSLLPDRVAFRDYARSTAALFHSVAEVSGRPVVVDSSKNPARAMAISRVQELETVLIHLTRHGLDFLDSSLRRRRRKLSLDAPHLPYEVFRLGLWWTARNRAAERAISRNRNGGMRLRYEDLISDPIGSLESVGRLLGIDMTPVQDHLRAGRPVPYRHLPNGSRHRLLGPKPLIPHYRAAPDLDPRLKRAFHLGAGRVSRRYGYR